MLMCIDDANVRPLTAPPRAAPPQALPAAAAAPPAALEMPPVFHLADSVLLVLLVPSLLCSKRREKTLFASEATHSLFQLIRFLGRTLILEP